MPFVLGIEGYMKTGKTTLGKHLSKKFNAPVLDTGVLYRIVASLLSKKEMTNNKIKQYVIGTSLDKIMDDLKIYFDYSLMCFNPIPCDIYSPKVSSVSALIGALTGDKWYYKFYSIIKKLSQTHNVILVGRNVLTMFPDLDIHIFLVANKQKIIELTRKEQKDLPYDEVIKLVNARNDNEQLIRKFSEQNSKTLVIDVSNMDEFEVLDFVSKIIEKRL